MVKVVPAAVLLIPSGWQGWWSLIGPAYFLAHYLVHLGHSSLAARVVTGWVQGLASWTSH